MKRFKINPVKIRPVMDASVLFNKVSEHDIQSTIATILMFDGWMVIRVNSGSARLKGRTVNFYEILNFNRMNKGFPDLLCIKQNNYVMIECKKPNGKLNQNQINFNTSTQKFKLNSIVIDNIDDATDIVLILHRTFKFTFDK